MLLLTPLAVEVAIVTFRGFAAAYTRDGSPFDHVKGIILGGVINSLVDLKLIQQPSEIPRPGYVELCDEGNSYWMPPAEYEELEDLLSPEISWAKLLAPVIPQEAPQLPTNLKLFNRWQERTGRTRKELAAEIGVSQSTLGRILKGVSTKNKKPMSDFARAVGLPSIQEEEK